MYSLVISAVPTDGLVPFCKILNSKRNAIAICFYVCDWIYVNKSLSAVGQKVWNNNDADQDLPCGIHG